ncbi:MAG TPA: SDR family oxidoreductase [Rhodospirillales bacterium]|nr:SDR family oxidoreductase [Rhodospirillales bacterium]
MRGLTGKRVLITAGAAGIGRRTAEAFAEAGARVFLCDIDEAALADLAAARPEIGALRADVAVEGDVERLFEAAMAALGGLDVLINNAGIAGPTGPVESLALEDWKRCLAVNLDGMFLCTRRAVPLIEAAGGGAIVNLSSTAGLHGFPNRTPYATAKWGVIGLTKTLAMELGPRGIRVNAICPGPVAGARIDRVIEADARVTGRPLEEVRDRYLRTNALRTFIDAADIANMILFLCSDLGRRVNGQAIAVDGYTETLRTGS